MHLLTAFVAMPAERRRLVVAAASLEIAAGVVFAFGPRTAAKVARWLARTRRPRPTDLDALAWAVSSAAHHLRRACLAQAFAARVLAERAGFAARLTLAVRHGPGGPAFHAWTEAGGRRFPETDARAGFEPLAILG